MPMADISEPTLPTSKERQLHNYQFSATQLIISNVILFEGYKG